jgi:hypothetical protein
MRMEWKKMRQIMEDHDVTPEFIIHGELREKLEY